jgi:hypothetical protein
MTVIFFLASVAALSAILSPAVWADGELARARQAREKFLENAKSHKRSEWLTLIQQFEQAASVQPRLEHAAKARFYASQLAWRSYEIFKQKEDAVKAGELAKRAVKNCSRCADSPAALIILGRSLMARNKLDEAYRELMKVELNHQSAPEVTEARKLLATLSGTAVPEQAPSSSSSSSSNQSASNNSTGNSSSSASNTASGGATAAASQKPPQTNSGASQSSNAKKATPPVKRAAPTAPKPRADGQNQFYAFFFGRSRDL